MTTLQTDEKDSGIDARVLLDTLTALRRGDFSVHMPNDWTGVPGKIADTLNQIVDLAERTTSEFERVAKVVGREGRVTERIQLPQTGDGWGRLVVASNAVINDLTAPMGEMTRVIGLVAAGDLRQTMTLEAGGFRLQGEFLRTAEIVNNMIGQLNGFSSEVTRVAREVGTEGKQAQNSLLSQLNELRRWEDVMLGREDRVQELKREINELCRRLDEPARYPSEEPAPAQSQAAKPKP